MTNVEISMAAAERLANAARKLVILGDDKGEFRISTDKLTISFDAVSIKNGNISSTTGGCVDDGTSYIKSVWDLTRPPIDLPDIARINRMATVLESYLISI